MSKDNKGKYEGESRTFAIYPDYWKDSWGEKPLLGLVVAENEFHACRRAYDKGYLTKNFTFEPEAREVSRSQASDLKKARYRRYR